MTIALQRKEGSPDTIYFDAVLSYSSTYQSQLTKHPIDGSGAGRPTDITSINDHVINDNPSYTLKGVISNADFNSKRPQGYTFKNNSPVTEPAQVIRVRDTLLNIPSTLLSFGSKPEPQVQMQDRVLNARDDVKNLLIDIRNKKETVRLIEFTDGKPASPIENLVITSLQFSEDANTGDILAVDMTLEKATFVILQEIKLAKRSKALGDKGASNVSKGDQNTPEVKKEIPKTVLQGMSKSLTELINTVNDSSKSSGEKAAAIVKALGDVEKL